MSGFHVLIVEQTDEVIHPCRIIDIGDLLTGPAVSVMASMNMIQYCPRGCKNVFALRLYDAYAAEKVANTLRISIEKYANDNL